MDRINTSTKAVDLFGAGKHGFKDGDLALGVVPTDLDAEWFNSVQEELLAVIEGASLVPSGASLTQLKQAVQILAGINDKSLSANGWMRFPSGIILQWGQGITEAGGAVTITFPLAFPTGPWAANATNAANAAPSAGAYFACGSFSAAGMGVWVQNATSGMYFHWFAVGR